MVEATGLFLSLPGHPESQACCPPSILTMANPQLENGYTKIANEIMEALTKANLNGTELAVALLIIRKTYGWKKKEDEISLNQFLKAIPVTKPCICKALKRLQLVNVIKLVKKGKSKISSNSYTFNKNYEEWQLVKKFKLVNNWKSTSKHLETKLVNKRLHTKETITKESIQKKERADARPHSLTQLEEYFIEIGCSAPKSEAETFWDHFTSNGWKIGGKTPMKDWKAAARNWVRRGKKKEISAFDKEFGNI